MSFVHVKVQQDPEVHITTKAEVSVGDGEYERGYDKGYEDAVRLGIEELPKWEGGVY